jgi:deazaflavin-dependent oxidoreductase (nitroreductase family)
MSDMADFNKQIINEFRENDGKVGGQFEGADLLILHSTGAKSGQERLNPLMFRPDGDRYVIFASKAGATSHPDWYYNVTANPSVQIELGSGTVAATATVADGAEHDRLWDAQKADVPQFGAYEETAGGRKIPVVVLTPA